MPPTLKLTYMKKTTILLIALFLTASFQGWAQDFKQAKISYDVEMDAEDMDPQAAMMMKDMKMVIAFQDEGTRMEMNMEMVNVVTIINSNENKGVVLMDMMGMKMATPIEDLEKMQEEQGGEEEMPEIRETGKTKKIAGYTCHQVFVKAEDSKEEIEMWVAKEFVANDAASMYSAKGLQGFPLEMDMDQDGAKMHLIATEVSTKKLNKDMFNPEVPDGYTINNMGGMGR
mgnify:CR=1 FL=1